MMVDALEQAEKEAHHQIAAESDGEPDQRLGVKGQTGLRDVDANENLEQA